MITAHRLGRRTAALVAASGVFAAVLAGCGDGDRPEAQPAPDVTRFVEGSFEDVPLFPRSEPVSQRHEKNDTTAQSYKARNTTAEQVLRFYDERLPGWQQLGPVEKVGATAYRGEWVRGGRRLLVSAAPAPGLGESDEIEAPVVQYSLTLGPA